ncbi:MAG: T9SS type A sorting domain-containing protein, partial [Candidatus Kapabacteria bacterium]|nr:T9SS type A sorting domain-containing protein [Candidatus Kapabacteria bacterium]
TEIRLYNAQSELVSVPFTGVLNSGEYSVRIPVEELSSGVYFYEMVSGPFKDTKKMIIVK